MDDLINDRQIEQIKNGQLERFDIPIPFNSIPFHFLFSPTLTNLIDLTGPPHLCMKCITLAIQFESYLNESLESSANFISSIIKYHLRAKKEKEIVK